MAVLFAVNVNVIRRLWEQSLLQTTTNVEAPLDTDNNNHNIMSRRDRFFFLGEVSAKAISYSNRLSIQDLLTWFVISIYSYATICLWYRAFPGGEK